MNYMQREKRFENIVKCAAFGLFFLSIAIPAGAMFIYFWSAGYSLLEIGLMFKLYGEWVGIAAFVLFLIFLGVVYITLKIIQRVKFGKRN